MHIYAVPDKIFFPGFGDGWGSEEYVYVCQGVN